MNIVTDKNGYALLFRHSCETGKNGVNITNYELQRFAIEILPFCIKGTAKSDIIIDTIHENYTIVRLTIPEKMTILLIAKMVNANITEEERAFVKEMIKEGMLTKDKLSIVKLGFYCLKTSDVADGRCGADFFVRFSGLEYLEEASE
jgi:hypothetical protein